MTRPETARGFRDVLPQEAQERATIAQGMSRVMVSWGYLPVEIPLLERYETLAETAGSAVEGRVFRLLDADGSLLALRPEITVPIARMAATRLDLAAAPARLRYVADVFREESSLRGRPRQFTQVGLELIGESGPAADAEVVCVLVDALAATGLKDFVVGLGTVAVWQALISRAGTGVEWSKSLLAAAHDRNIAGIDELAAGEGVPPAVGEALRAVPRIRGGRKALEACRQTLDRCGAGDVLADVSRMWDLLERAGVADRVTADFGVMRSFDYYTGMVLEVYAQGIGLPLGGGGRYDGVLGRFGAPAAAAGFAIGIERLHVALAEQGLQGEESPVDAVLGGEDGEVFAAAVRLREAGSRVVLAPGRHRAGTERLAAALGVEEALFVEAGEVQSLARAPEAMTAPDAATEKGGRK